MKQRLLLETVRFIEDGLDVGLPGVGCEGFIVLVEPARELGLVRAALKLVLDEVLSGLVIDIEGRSQERETQ